ncbi:unnamed protein product [Scytosiphon promiscuus]
MVCVAMLFPPLDSSAVGPTTAGNPASSMGTKQGDAAGGPAVRSTAASAAGGGVLSVFTMGGERSFEVERALQRPPQEQLVLPYTPAGMAHTTVWRSVAALPNFVGGGEGGEGAEASSPSSLASPRRVERGDAVLVWDQDGVVHGYTRWHSGGSSVGVGDGSGGGAGGRSSVLKAESRESLEAMIPELGDIDGPVSCLSFDAVEEEAGGSTSRRRRRVLAGCKDTARYISLDDVVGDRTETPVASVAAPVSAVAFNTRARFFPQDRGIEDVWGGDVLGFACNELDLLAWLVRRASGEDDGAHGSETRAAGRNQEPRWLTGMLPLPGAGSDQVECMACADFCRDGSTSVAVGTRLGKVVVYGAEAEADERRRPVTGGLEESRRGRGEGLAFGLGDFDDDSEDESAPGETVHQPHPRRWDSTSPRPPGSAPPPVDRQNHARRGADRPGVVGGGGGGGGAANSGSRGRGGSNPPRPLLSVRWQRDVPHGVLKIAWGDFNHDGVSEMVVATQYGVHVFRPDYLKEAGRFAKTMHALKMLQPKEGGEGDGGVRSEMASTSDGDVDVDGGGYGVL